MEFSYHLNIENYRAAESIWSGILRFVKERRTIVPPRTAEELSEKEIFRLINKEAQRMLVEESEDGQTSTKEMDTFRKAISNLKNGKTLSIKRANLYRLLFVLHLASDLDAQHFLMDYLHMNELSARVLEDFIVLSALKLQLSWSQTKELLYNRYEALIAGQEDVPDNVEEGYTAEVYTNVIDRFASIEDLTTYLDNPKDRASFAKSSNTRYLALFYDVFPKSIQDEETGSPVFRLFDPEGNIVVATEYRKEFFGLSGRASKDALTLEEIDALSEIFEDIFLDEAAFNALVYRHRITDVSSETFILSYLYRLDPEDEDFEFYICFSDPDDFKNALDEWLLYYGFPLINPACSSFERLLMDIHQEMLEQVEAKEEDDFSNAAFYEAYLAALRFYLRQLIKK